MNKEYDIQRGYMTPTVTSLSVSAEMELKHMSSDF